jgi:glutamyl-tRNA synthetase
VVPSPAFFDLKKLSHVNAEHLRALPVDEFVRRCRPWIPAGWDLDVFARMAALVQERVTTLSQAAPMVEFLFADEPVVDQASWDKVMRRPGAAAVLDSALAAYRTCEWTAAELHRVTAKVAEANGMALNKAQAPVRVAVTGRTVGPPLFESLAVLGRERTLRRLSDARDRLGSPG